MNIIDVQPYLKELNIDGWLLTDFQSLNKPALQLLGIDSDQHLSRRWFYFIPRIGAPVKLVHAIESKVLDQVPGNKITYSGRKNMIERLGNILQDVQTIAMEYSPMGRLPTVSRVDAGTIELIRWLNKEIVSSADLIQIFTSIWNEEALDSHLIAADVLRSTVDATWKYIADNLSSNTLTERDVQLFMLERFAKNECRTSHPPIVAVGPNSADPHYSPPHFSSKIIQPDQLVLIDLWCKENRTGSVYADITWTAWTGKEPPGDVEFVFEVVKEARDAVVAAVETAFESHDFVTGSELDQIARKIITESGYGKEFVHRTGHSLDQDVHGAGANLDSLESDDERRILPGTGFTVEPGIYLPDRFGIRSELNVVVLPGGQVKVTGEPIQNHLVRITSP